MGRKKSEMKRIEDKLSRRVEFSKRREELNKRARQLSTLSDCDDAVIVSSAEGKLYEYCSGGMNSVEHMTSRYKKRCREAEEETSQGVASKVMGINNEGTRFRSCSQLQESIKRVDENPNAFSVTDIKELEEELTDALMQTRSGKVILSLTLKSKEVMLSRYHRSQAGEGTIQVAASKDTGDKKQEIKFRTCKELLELVERVDENPNVFSVTDIKELEQELTEALMETRSRKGINNQGTKFRTCKELLELVERVDENPYAFSVNDIKELVEELTDALKETRSRKERKLMEENEELKQQVASAAGKQEDVIDDS